MWFCPRPPGRGRLWCPAGSGRNLFEAVTEETVELKLPSSIEAIGEAAAARPNAVLHGNRQEESVPVEVGMAGTDAGLTITVRDRGQGFDSSHLPDPTAEENILKASGRGILFMRTFMDEVGWEHPPGGGTL